MSSKEKDKQIRPSPEDQVLYVVRLTQFLNIYTVYQDFLSGHYQPSTAGCRIPSEEGDIRVLAEMGNTLMFQMYAFFYSLVEGRSDTVDAFRVWREKYPEERKAIEAMYALVQPLLSELRSFRNSLGFHGGRNHAKQRNGFELFNKHEGGYVLSVIKLFKSLNAAFLGKDTARANGSAEDAKQARAWIDHVTAKCKSMMST